MAMAVAASPCRSKLNAVRVLSDGAEQARLFRVARFTTPLFVQQIVEVVSKWGCNMRQLALAVALCVAGAGILTADNRAPNRQTFVLECGGATVTFVSPVEPARAAQIVGTTGVGVLQQVLFSDASGATVLFEQPSFKALRSSALTTCTVAVPEGTVTFTVLVTPQGNQ